MFFKTAIDNLKVQELFNKFVSPRSIIVNSSKVPGNSVDLYKVLNKEKKPIFLNFDDIPLGSITKDPEAEEVVLWNQLLGLHENNEILSAIKKIKGKWTEKKLDAIRKYNSLNGHLGITPLLRDHNILASLPKKGENSKSYKKLVDAFTELRKHNRTDLEEINDYLKLYGTRFGDKRISRHAIKRIDTLFIKNKQGERPLLSVLLENGFKNRVKKLNDVNIPKEEFKKIYFKTKNQLRNIGHDAYMTDKISNKNIVSHSSVYDSILENPLSYEARVNLTEAAKKEWVPTQWKEYQIKKLMEQNK